MNKKQIIKKTEEFVKKKLIGDPGHDWSHIDRVRNLALYLAKKEKADLFAVELAALLHDVADHKFHKNKKLGGQLARSWLKKNQLENRIVQEIVNTVDFISWKEGKNKVKLETQEGRIVQDADRLDAIGAIGVARAFSYASYKNRPMTDTVNHFYEKLLLLKNRMNTKTGKQLALRRHKFLEIYLKELYSEWKELR